MGGGGGGRGGGGGVWGGWGGGGAGGGGGGALSPAEMELPQDGLSLLLPLSILSTLSPTTILLSTISPTTILLSLPSPLSLLPPSSSPLSLLSTLSYYHPPLYDLSHHRPPPSTLSTISPTTILLSTLFTISPTTILLSQLSTNTMKLESPLARTFFILLARLFNEMHEQCKYIMSNVAYGLNLPFLLHIFFSCYLTLSHLSSNVPSDFLPH